MRSILWAAILASLVACGRAAYTPPPPPTPEAAQAYLSQLVALVADSGAQAACSVGASTCAHSLQEADPAAFPRLAPHVVGTDVLPASQRPDGTWETGGRILKVCGIDGKHKPYYSELLIFQDGDRLISTNPLYWTGTTVGSNPVAASPPHSPCS